MEMTMDNTGWLDIGFVGSLEQLAAFKKQLEQVSDHIIDGFRPARDNPPAQVLYDGTHAFGFMLHPDHPVPEAPEGVVRTIPGVAATLLGI